MSLDQTQLTLAINAVQNNPLDLATASVPLSKTYAVPLPNGSGAGQASKIFHDTRTVNASSNDDLDFAGVLVDGLGNVLTFTAVKALIVKSADANVQNFTIGGAAANQFASWISAATTSITMRPGGLFMLTATDATAYTVTAGTGDIFRVANGAGVAINYDIIVIGI